MADPLASWMWMSLTAPPPPPQDNHVLVNLDTVDRFYVPEDEKVQLQMPSNKKVEVSTVVDRSFVLENNKEQLQSSTDEKIEVSTIVDANPARKKKTSSEGHFVSWDDKDNIGTDLGDDDSSNLAKYLDRINGASRTSGNKDRAWIWKVHRNMKEFDKEAYEPKIVSIGPFYHGNKKLKPMEDIKRTYLKLLLERSPKNSLRKYLNAIRGMEVRARKQYAEQINMSSKAFIEMLVVDGCFIVEHLLRSYFKKRPVHSDYYVGVGWSLEALERDLLLLENQIPFFILEKLLQESVIFDESAAGGTPEKASRPPSVKRIALRFLGFDRLPPHERPKTNKVHHLLHLKYICLIPNTPPRPSPPPDPASKLLGKVSNMLPFAFYGLLYVVLIKCLGERDEYFAGNWNKEDSPKKTCIPCATELHRFGVKFERKQLGDVDSYLNITFSSSDGVLAMPRYVMGPMTISEFRNFIAFERCQRIGNYFTEYAIFMDNIIDTVNDVVILRKYGIVETTLGSDKQVAQTFNKLLEGTHLSHVTDTFDPALEEQMVPWQRGRIGEVMEDVNKHCEIPQNRWRASLRSSHLRSPWATISLFAVIVAITTSIIQASFAISRPQR